MKEKEEREKETTTISILVFMMATFKNSLLLVGCIFSLKTWILELQISCRNGMLSCSYLDLNSNK